MLWRVMLIDVLLNVSQLYFALVDVDFLFSVDFIVKVKSHLRAWYMLMPVCNLLLHSSINKHFYLAHCSFIGIY